MPYQALLERGEYAAAGLYEQPERSLFFRKALALRRYYEKCPLPVWQKGQTLYPCGVLPRDAEITPFYLTGLQFHAPRLSTAEPEAIQTIHSDFCRFTSSVPAEHTVAGNMYTHSMPNYERILAEGLASYRARVEGMRDVELRDGLLQLLDGITTYCRRCVEYLEEVGADPALIEALSRVPMLPAENIYDAIVGWNFILYLDNCDNLGALGRGLLPYFHGENIVPHLSQLYDNLDVNNGYSMSLDSACPALTVQCLEAARGKRRPMIELLIDEDTPDEIWEKALEIVRSGGGQPAFYNAKALLGGLKRRFPTIRDEDLNRFCGGGCTEAMIAGLSNVGSLDAGINLLLLLRQSIDEELCDSADFDTFRDRYLCRVERTVERVMAAISDSRERRARDNPLPMRTLLIDDCIDRSEEYNAGGARYRWSIINFAGMINVIDALLAIRTLIFEKKIYTAQQMIALLDANDPAFLRTVRALRQSFGKDDAAVNAFSHALSSRIFAMTEKGQLYRGEGFLSASIQFMSQVSAGHAVGATPDGRCAGAPLCDSLAAIFGEDNQGPTAPLGSVTALDLSRALGIPVLNFNLSRTFDDAILRALIMGYMQKGGMQLQITCASPDELRHALEDPASHGNLIVRVGGYSEYFTRLSPELQRMVVDRTVQEQGLGI